MNAKALIPLVAGLGIGGLALKMGLDTLRNAKGTQRPVQTVQLCAAAQDILRGEMITAEMLRTVTVPVSAVPEDAIRDPEKAVGRVPTLDAPANLPLLEHTLLPKGEELRLRVKQGYRAVSVKIDEGSGVDYHLEPGSYVDVIGSFRVRGDDGRPEMIATTILENVEVAAVGERITPATSKDEEGKPTQRRVRAVTLFVQPQEVQRLHIVEQEGRIKLCLRSEDDTTFLDEKHWDSKLALTGEVKPPEPPVIEPNDDAESVASKLLGGAMGWLAAALPKPGAESPAAYVAAGPPQPVRMDWQVNIYRGAALETKVFEDCDARALLGDAAPAPVPPPAMLPPAAPPAGTAAVTPPAAPRTGAAEAGLSGMLSVFGAKGEFQGLTREPRGDGTSAATATDSTYNELEETPEARPHETTEPEEPEE